MTCDRVIPLDELDLTPAQERLLRRHLTVRTGHGDREVVDLRDWQEWEPYSRREPPEDGRATP